MEFGADDYITKPFDLREVVARIRTILRRLEQAHHVNERETEKWMRSGLKYCDRSGRKTGEKDGAAVELTPKNMIC
ncbi:hypothetical protein PO124_32325 [Bacillus licheniformis]|nr:hypothetical protein [Bacillus licheniformis]